jgi:hypothetical protein
MKKVSMLTLVLALGLSGSLLLLVGTIGGASETKAVKVRDDCEPTSFNAALGPGACVGEGKTTFPEFIQELTADQAVEAWRFNPPHFDVVAGKMLLLQSRGGETHTFTKVEEFGGGFVAPLNALSGNPIPRPECAIVLPGGGLAPQPPSEANTFVEAGETEAGPTAGGSILPIGEESRFQCWHSPLDAHEGKCPPDGKLRLPKQARGSWVRIPAIVNSWSGRS